MFMPNVGMFPYEKYFPYMTGEKGMNDSRRFRPAMSSKTFDELEIKVFCLSHL